VSTILYLVLKIYGNSRLEVKTSLLLAVGCIEILEVGCTDILLDFETDYNFIFSSEWPGLGWQSCVAGF